MNKKQLSINMIANIIAFVVSLGINFFLTPYLINTVGREAYSFIPLVGNITSYVSIISTSLNSMAGRFITIAIHENDNKSANIYFNTVLFSNVLLSVIFGVIFTFVVLFLDSFLKIPLDIVLDVKSLFALTFLSSVIALVTNIFGVATFCQNRLDIRSVLSISESIIKVVVLILLFLMFEPTIVFIGIATLVITITTNTANIFITKRLLPQINIAKEYFDKKAIAILVGAGIWNSVGQTSSILLTGFDLLLANTFLGVSEAGYIALSKIIPNLLYTLSATLAAVFMPHITILYAKKDIESLLKEVKLSLQISGLLLSIPLAGFVAYGDIFYRLWLPAQNAQFIYILTIITLIQNFFEVFVCTLPNVFVVKNMLKMPTIVTLITAMLNIIIVLGGLNILPSFGIYIIAGVSGVLSVIKLLTFTPIYAANCLGVVWTTYYRHIFKSVFTTFAIICVFVFIRLIINISGWTMLIGAVAVGSVIGLIANSFIMLDSTERKQLIYSFKNFRWKND